jgi:ABC-type spermidine/putrescine transport system permease subunit I
VHRPWLGRLLLVAPALALVLAVVIVPVARLLAASVWQGHSLTLQSYQTVVHDPQMLQAFVRSIWLAVVTTVVAVLLGYPIAYLMAVQARRAAGALLLIVLLPFWTSITVRSFAFIILLGRQGPINRILEALGIIRDPLPLLFNPVSVVVGLTHIGLPLMVLPLYAAMRQIDRSLMRVASSLGAGSMRAFWEVFLPLSAPGLAAGATLVFMTTVGAYVIPALLGGTHDSMVAQYIVTAVNVFHNVPLAATVTVGLLAVTAASLGLVNRVVGLERVWSTRGRVA